MADFENHAAAAAGITAEIERKLVALSIDWRDGMAMRQLAREALTYDKSQTFPGIGIAPVGQLTRMELCGLIGLMLATMTEGAQKGEELHGSDAWKALARALWEEKEGHSQAGST